MPRSDQSGSSVTGTCRAKPAPGEQRTLTWTSRAAFLLLLAVAGCSLAVAGKLAAQESATADSSAPAEDYRAAAMIVLAACGLWQLALIRRAWRTRDRLKVVTMGIMSPFWQSLLLCLAGSYALALTIGPGVAAQNVFAALAVFSYTLNLARFVRGPGSRVNPPWQDHRSPFGPRRAAIWALCGLILLASATELGLRIHETLTRQPLLVQDRVRRATLPPGVEFHGRTSNRLGYWDEEFQAPQANEYRVVVLGDELTLAGDATSNFVTQLEAQASDVNVLHFGINGASPAEYVVTLAAEAAPYQPQLVLVVVNLANDVTEQKSLPGPFDWRGLRLCAWTARTWGVPQPPVQEPVASETRSRGRFQLAGAVTADVVTESANDDTAFGDTFYQQLLHAAEQQLTLCRQPISPELERQWAATQASLLDLQETCRELNCRLVVVLAPSRLQVDGKLRDVAARRSGCGADDVDAGLPQRQLANFAESAGITTVDLTPILEQAAGAGYLQNEAEWTAETHARIAEFLLPVIEASATRTASAFPGDR